MEAATSSDTLNGALDSNQCHHILPLNRIEQVSFFYLMTKQEWVFEIHICYLMKQENVGCPVYVSI
jgi:hypothetical protein